MSWPENQPDDCIYKQYICINIHTIIIVYLAPMVDRDSDSRKFYIKPGFLIKPGFTNNQNANIYIKSATSTLSLTSQ